MGWKTGAQQLGSLPPFLHSLSYFRACILLWPLDEISDRSHKFSGYSEIIKIFYQDPSIKSSLTVVFIILSLLSFSQKELLPLLIFSIVCFPSSFYFYFYFYFFEFTLLFFISSFSPQHFIMKIFRQNKQKNYGLNIRIIPPRFYNECFAIFALSPICVLIPLFFHQSPLFFVWDAFQSKLWRSVHFTPKYSHRHIIN